MGSLRNYEWHCILSSSTISFPFPAPHIASPSFSAPFSHSCSPDDLPLSAPIFSFLSPTLATSPQKKNMIRLHGAGSFRHSFIVGDVHRLERKSFIPPYILLTILFSLSSSLQLQYHHLSLLPSLLHMHKTTYFYCPP